MKRDMDLARALLLEIEARPEYNGQGLYQLDPDDIVIEGHPYEEVAYTMRLLIEAGFVLGDISSFNAPTFIRLTWNGHEFLERVRDPEVWRKAKEEAKHVGSFGFDVLGALARGFIKTKIEEHTGVKLDL